MFVTRRQVNEKQDIGAISLAETVWSCGEIALFLCFSFFVNNIFFCLTISIVDVMISILDIENRYLEDDLLHVKVIEASP